MGDKMSLPELFAPETDNPHILKAIALRDAFATDAVARDQAGGQPLEQVQLLKQSGLLTILVPTALGGAGEPTSTVLRITREFAKVDGSLGHIYGYHFGALHGFLFALPDPRAADWLRRTAAGNWFWGNTGNSFSKTLFGRRTDAGWILDGFKPFASGSHVADHVTTSWQENDAEGERHFAAIPANRDGIHIEHDWDGIGQTQTGSGTVTYRNVHVSSDEETRGWGDASLPVRSLGPQLQQSVLLNVFVGTAQGALLQGRAYTTERSRPWIWGGHERHIDDPWVKRVYGELYIKVKAATALADRAARKLDWAIARGPLLTEAERGETAVAVAAANVLAGEVALEVSEQVFEVTGARSAVRSEGLDRFWRNARIHTLHNPAEYKTQTVGRWYLTGDYPEPGVFR